MPRNTLPRKKVAPRVTRAMWQDLLDLLSNGISRGHEARNLMGNECDYNSRDAHFYGIDGAIAYLWGFEKASKLAPAVLRALTRSRIVPKNAWKELVDFLDETALPDTDLLARIKEKAGE